MEDKSDIKILKEFAKSTNRAIHAKEVPYPLPKLRVQTILKFKRTVCIPNNPEKSSFYVCVNDKYSKIGESTVYSGSFIPLPSKTKSRVTLRKRNILDKLNIFSKPNGIGVSYFDSNVVISGDIDQELKKILYRSQVQKEIIDALKIESNTEILIGQYRIDFIPELSIGPHLSILNRYGWETDKNKIEKYFYHIEKIREAIR